MSVIVFEDGGDVIAISTPAEPTVIQELVTEHVMVLTVPTPISTQTTETGDVLVFEEETSLSLVDNSAADEFVVLSQIGPQGVQGPPGTAGAPGPAGPQGPAGAVTNVSYIHYQSSPATVWTIAHPLSFQPSVVVVDSLKREIWPGDVEYLTASTIRLTFSASVGGEAYLS
jgi:hypothetical protein